MSPGGDGLALHPKACSHELMCIVVWFLVEGGGCRVSLSLLFLSGAWGRRKNGGSGHCFCPPVIEMALCQGDFLRLCPSSVGSEPKGQNVTLSRERASCPQSPSILPRLKGSSVGPRGSPAESLLRAVVWWGQGMMFHRGRRP